MVYKQGKNIFFYFDHAPFSRDYRPYIGKIHIYEPILLKFYTNDPWQGRKCYLKSLPRPLNQNRFNNFRNVSIFGFSSVMYRQSRLVLICFLINIFKLYVVLCLIMCSIIVTKKHNRVTI